MEPSAIVSRLRERCCALGTDDHGHTDCWLYGLAIEEIEDLEHALTREWGSEPEPTWADSDG